MTGVSDDTSDPIDTEFFGSPVRGQMVCVFDHSAPDLVLGHIEVAESLIAGTGVGRPFS